MAVNAALVGVPYRAEPYLVAAERIAAFADAVGAMSPAHRDRAAARALGYDDVVAPPTFAVVLAQRAEARYLADPECGVDFSRVVHAEESFTHHRPLVAGMTIDAEASLTSLAERAGLTFVTTTCQLSEGGSPVCDVVSTLAVRGEGR